MKRLKLSTNEHNEITFNKGFNEFILNCKGRGLRNTTIRHYEQSYKQIIKYLNKDILLSDINSSTFSNFIINMRSNNALNSQTIYSYCRDLKTILNFFINSGYVKPFKITLPKVDKQPIATYTDEELQKLLKRPNLNKCTFCEYRNYVIICMFLSIGIRLRSLINIKIKDIDFNNNMINITYTKNHKALILPLNDYMVNILKEYLKYRQYTSTDDYLFCNVYNKQLTKSALIQTIRQYNISRGVNTYGIHRFRHTFAKKYILNGGNVVILQKILGHSSLQITQNYINVLVGDIKKEVNNYNILKEFTHKHIIMGK